MPPSSERDPFQILGLPPNASETEVRARYLELVKQHPPERDPVKFQEIRTAYDAAKDPLTIARRLLAPPPDDAPPEWSDLLKAQQQKPPRLSPAFLLSLGNRSGDLPSAANRPPARDPKNPIPSRDETAAS